MYDKTLQRKRRRRNIRVGNYTTTKFVNMTFNCHSFDMIICLTMSNDFLSSFKLKVNNSN